MSYTHKEGHFAGFDELDLYYQEWTKPNSKLHIVIVHGAGEHSGRYGHLTDAFADLPVSFYALDHRGHGKSEGSRGHVNNWTDYTKDLDVFVDKVLSDNNLEKVLMLGHSMGGNIAINYAIHDQSKLYGLVASSPCMKMKIKINPVKNALGLMMSKIWPRLTMSSGLPAEAITHDMEEVAKYKNDPLVHDKASARWFVEFVKAGEKGIEHADMISIPTLVIQGMDDSIVDPEGTKSFYAGIKYSNKKLLLFDGLYNETFNEVEADRNEVIGQVKDWVTKQWLS